jgi:predicted phosphoserine aminotransferase
MEVIMSPMFIPGPVDVADEVLQAQAQPMLPHRSKEFEAIFHRASDKARQLFFTQYRVFLFTSSGTGCQEAAMRNLVRDRVLCCRNGAFSNRWFDVARLNGKSPDSVEAPWGQAIQPEQVAEALEGAEYDAITIVHNETSTGVENPVREIAAVVKDLSPETLVCVDAVSSLSGSKIEMDAWGIDFLFTSSQKALALPPGLALCGVSDRALARAETVPDRGWYFDLLRMENHRNKNSTPATPAESLVFALDVQLDRIMAEGIETRFARHSALANRARAWAKAKSWPLYAQEGYRSKTLTVVENPPSFDISALNKFMAAKDVRLANGYGDLKGKTFRIAHMGEIQMADLELLLGLIDEFLEESGS